MKQKGKKFLTGANRGDGGGKVGEALMSPRGGGRGRGAARGIDIVVKPQTSAGTDGNGFGGGRVVCFTSGKESDGGEEEADVFDSSHGCR